MENLKISEEQNITPWEVEGSGIGVDKKIDYKKIVDTFGSTLIDAALLDKFERVTGVEPHLYLRRGIFFSHRDLDKILDLYAAGKKFYLYTGRGPSSDALHLGHLIPFYFCKWLQDVFDVPLVIQLTDDEKIVWKNLSMDQSWKYVMANAKDIIAVGFNPEKTFIFANTRYIGHLFENILQIERKININQCKKVFGFADEDMCAKISFPARQIAPCFSSSFKHIFKTATNVPCLIPCAIDQDPYFRLTRDIAQTLGTAKPALVHSNFLPALQGAGSKMSASLDTSAIFVTDDPKKVKTKINKYAFSGGKVTTEEHREKGGNAAIDISYIYLTYLLEDDAELETIREQYTRGELLSGQIKAKLIAVINDKLATFMASRSNVTDETVEQFMAIRDIPF